MEQLKTALRAHRKPKPLTIAERFKFHKRTQRESESVAEYVVALKELATHCEFGGFLNEALRDHLVCGLYRESTQKRLLTEVDLTFKKACKIAQAMEMADKNASELNSEATQGIHALQKPARESYKEAGATLKTKDPKAGGGSCYRCGGLHLPSNCQFKTEKCRKCGKTGHIERKCHTKQLFQGEVDQELDEYGQYGIHTVTRSRSSAYIVDMKVNGHTVNMLEDTGAVVSVVPEWIYQKFWSHLPLKKARELRSYTGDKLKLVGELTVSVEYGTQKCKLPVVIVKGDKPALLGRNWLEKIKLDWGEIFSLNKSHPVDTLVTKYSKLFDAGHGKVNNFKATLALQPGAKPVNKKVRPVPYALKEQVEAELDRLEQQGIIKKVERSSWAGPIVIVPKVDKTIRICGDYKVSINPHVIMEGYQLPTIQDLFSSLNNGSVFSK